MNKGWNDYDSHEHDIGTCDKCGSHHVLSITAKLTYDYLPNSIALGDDCVRIDYCAICGKIQGEFPLNLPELK